MTYKNILERIQQDLDSVEFNIKSKKKEIRKTKGRERQELFFDLKCFQFFRMALISCKEYVEEEIEKEEL